MELLKEIKDREWPDDPSLLKIRTAARAVLFDDQRLVPILFVSKKSYHKLPGGGIEEGEDASQALHREVLEEVGSTIEVQAEIGEIIEFRSNWNIKQRSYCYMGNILTKGEPTYTEREQEEGFQLLWVSLDEAISRIEHDQPADYQGAFIKERDLAFLKKAQSLKQGGPS